MSTKASRALALILAILALLAAASLVLGLRGDAGGWAAPGAFLLGVLDYAAFGLPLALAAAAGLCLARRVPPAAIASLAFSAFPLLTLAAAFRSLRGALRPGGFLSSLGDEALFALLALCALLEAVLIAFIAGAVSRPKVPKEREGEGRALVIAPGPRGGRLLAPGKAGVIGVTGAADGTDAEAVKEFHVELGEQGEAPTDGPRRKGLFEEMPPMPALRATGFTDPDFASDHPLAPAKALPGEGGGFAGGRGIVEAQASRKPATAIGGKSGASSAKTEGLVDGGLDGRAADEDLASEDLACEDVEVPLNIAAGGIEFTSVPPGKAAHEGLADRDAAARRKPKAKGWSVPTDLLTQYPDGQYWIIDDATRQAAETLRATLEEFNIKAEVTGIRKGPVITMFEILPAPGVKLSRIVNLQDNIALRLAASSIRMLAPIPGKHAVGIEVPNKNRNIVSFREMIESEATAGKKHEIPVVLGKDISGEAQVIDLSQMPHLLIAGATGAGKSVCVNSFILSILYRRSPEEVKMILIDPKIVELKLYNDIPHLLTPVITEPKRAFQALQYCIYEMERRYSMLDAMGVRDIKSYNRRVRERDVMQEKLPYLVVFIDEFADLMATTGKELESTLARLAAMSRAVGIHLVLATQRPSIDVITGLIKANIPSRIAFMVASKMDSRIIIDAVGAEKLLGRGDMLLSSAQESFPIRIQGAFVSEEEVERVVAHVKTLGEPDYIDEEIFIDEEDEAEPTLFNEEGDDPMMDKALEIVLQQGKASASYLQRRLKIGYNRAARIVEMMEERGIVGPQQGSRPRDLIHVPDKL